ncbi:MAG: hypothetical protein WAJ99_13675 [Candidatus Sulfotelmatobacter sp.]
MNEQKRGMGYYSYRRVRNTTTAGRLGAMVIGGVWVAGGLFVIARLLSVRMEEFRAWGSSDSHVVGFIFGICLLGIGAFAMHTGVIYYSRKLVRWVSQFHNTTQRR